MSNMKKIQQIEDAKDLAQFIEDLMQDYRSDSPEWENKTLLTYLEAMSAWVKDSRGYYRNNSQSFPDKEAWQVVALALLAARGYE